MISSDALQTCIRHNEQTLNKQSRSFAIPIFNLDQRFRIPVMVQYNLNKTIDTIEDNPDLPTTEKIDSIHRVCEQLAKLEYCAQTQQSMLAVTPKDEHYVFSNYQYTIELLKTLSAAEQKLAIDWTQKMAEGMCLYLEKPIMTHDDLNDYCYFVAGTVGIYLTQLLQLNGCGVAPQQVIQLEKDAVSFGLFLQKLNIIRDFNEDTHQKKRQFWPQNYFDQGLDRTTILNTLCNETLTNDVPHAINYFKNIPAGNDSFDYFIRFILASGLEYLKLLNNNDGVFSERKVKLPKFLIKTLYNKVRKLSREEFLDDCQELSYQPN